MFDVNVYVYVFAHACANFCTVMNVQIKGHHQVSCSITLFLILLFTEPGAKLVAVVLVVSPTTPETKLQYNVCLFM